LSEYATIVADAGYTYHTTFNTIRFWSNGFTLREKLHENLTQALDKVKQNNCESKLCWEQHPNLREELKTNCTNLLIHFQSDYAHLEIQQLSDKCFGDNLKEVDTTRIDE
jgi:hypothetical protein